MLEVDWDGNILWEHHDAYHHHDARRTESGGLHLHDRRTHDRRCRRKSAGRTTRHRRRWVCGAMCWWKFDAAGNRIWEWHAAEHLDPSTDIITFNDSREEWSHGNTIVPLPGRRVMFSFRNVSTVGIIDQDSGEITWKLGLRSAGPTTRSVRCWTTGMCSSTTTAPIAPEIPCPIRGVIEVDPATNEIVWQYTDNPPVQLLQRLHLRRTSPAQRQHADYGRTLWKNVSGYARRPRGVGVHQPALRTQRAGLPGQRSFPRYPTTCPRKSGN